MRIARIEMVEKGYRRQRFWLSIPQKRQIKQKVYQKDLNVDGTLTNPQSTDHRKMKKY